jgi:hypothetical protein
MATETRIMAVIPYDQYKKLITPPPNKQKSPDVGGGAVHDDDDDDNQDQPTVSGDKAVADANLPSPLELVVHCVPRRQQQNALLTLQYIASLNGAILYDPDSGEILINRERVPGSNLAEILRAFLSPRRPGNSQHKESLGIRPFLDALCRSAIPPSISSEPYWQQYMRNQRQQQQQHRRRRRRRRRR